jgi:hypothetical protein
VVRGEDLIVFGRGNNIVRIYAGWGSLLSVLLANAEHDNMHIERSFDQTITIRQDPRMLCKQ